jgi:hypothetical protein
MNLGQALQGRAGRNEQGTYTSEVNVKGAVAEEV